jgi:hypothetical protein
MVAVVAVAVAVLGRARRSPEPVRTGGHVPQHVDRHDFPSPDTPWLVVAFTSATCRTCAATWSEVQGLASDRVAVAEAEVGRDRHLHQRYAVDAVPLTVIADAHGAVRRSFLGPLAPGALASGMAELADLPPA